MGLDPGEKQQSCRGHLDKAELLALRSFLVLHATGKCSFVIVFFKYSIYTLIHAGSEGYASAYLAYPVAPPLTEGHAGRGGRRPEIRARDGIASERSVLYMPSES